MTAHLPIPGFLTCILASSLVAGSALGVTDDRAYLLGDDTLESASAGATVGVDLGQGPVSLDSQGPPGMSAFLDIDVNGTPTYVSVSDRPGADPTGLGAEFGGPGSGDYLSTPISMNSPSTMWNNPNLFPVTEFGLNYDGIFSHGIQLWAKPNSASQGVRQDLVIDTPQNGIYITAANTWGLVFDANNIDSGASVDFDDWTHVMQIAGFSDPILGQSNHEGALLVNGVAVAASPLLYDGAETPLSVGANQDGTANFYDGVLDDVRLFFWGNNFAARDPDGMGRMGQDWGPLNLSVDNEWIAMELADLGVTEAADVNLDGTVNDSDVTAFLPTFGNVNLVNGVQVGDWITRQDGDLNYDGTVDLNDAFILNDGLIAATGSGLDFGLLGQSVPEPRAATMLVIGLLLTLHCRAAATRDGTKEV